MAIELTINGLTYSFPANRDSPGWGTEVTEWAQAVSDALGSVVGTGDIVQTAFGLNNNQSSPSNVTGLSFDSAQIRGAIVDYSIYRVTNGVGATELVEAGTLYASYKSTAAVWEMAQVGVGAGTTGVTLSITNTGQVQYTSTNLSGGNYVGTMHFRARSLTQ